LADELKSKYDADVQLIKGSGGVFDVKLDGRLIYSKDQTGRFPDHVEVFERLGQ
jgi:selenoprotein W-related protein